MYNHLWGTNDDFRMSWLRVKIYREPRQYYDAAIARDPKEWAPVSLVHSCLLVKQKWALAARDFNTVLQLSPTNYLAAIFRGWVNNMGDYK